MSDKLQIHVSGLNLLSKCGIAFSRRYLGHERTPTSIAAAIGTAVDRAVSKDLDAKKSLGALLPVEEVKDIARDSLVREWERGVEATGEDTDAGIEASKDRAIDMSVDLAKLHHTTAAPGITPTHIQRTWTLDVVGLPIQLAGAIDVQEGLTALRDTKTSTRPPIKTIADTSLQLTMYALAVNQHDGAIPKQLVLDYLIRTPKRKEMKLVQIATTRTKEDFGPLLERVAAAAKTIEAGSFTPAPPDSWWCSEKCCAFHGSCRFALRPISVAGSDVVKAA